MNRRARFVGNSQQTPHSRRQTQGNRRRSDENRRDLDNNGRRNNLHVSHIATSRSDDHNVRAHVSNTNTQTTQLQQSPLDAAENHGRQSEFGFITQVPDLNSKSFTFSRAAQIERRTQLDSDNKSVILNNVHYHILSLPDDVLFLILSFLQPAELCQAGCVCQRFYYLTAQDTVWLQHAKRTAVVKRFFTRYEL